MTMKNDAFQYSNHACFKLQYNTNIAFSQKATHSVRPSAVTLSPHTRHPTPASPHGSRTRTRHSLALVPRGVGTARVACAHIHATPHTTASPPTDRVRGAHTPTRRRAGIARTVRTRIAPAPHVGPTCESIPLPYRAGRCLICTAFTFTAPPYHYSSECRASALALRRLPFIQMQI